MRTKPSSTFQFEFCRFALAEEFLQLVISTGKPGDFTLILRTTLSALFPALCVYRHDSGILFETDVNQVECIEALSPAFN